MNQILDSTFIHFPTPADPAEDPAGGEPKRGRKSGYAPRVIDMLCDSIRRFGLSDSAAAEQQGMSTSTLSRWKQLHPEIGIKLKQARQEIRTFHLQRIMDHAAAEDGKGWRASAWILERLFPGDYSPRMTDRHSYLNLEDRLHDKEAHEALDEQLRELHAMQAEERAARAAAQAAEAAASAGTAGSDDLPEGNAQTAHRGVATTTEVRAERFYSEGDSRNSRNSGGVEAPDAPVVATGLRPVPASDSHNSRNSDGARAGEETAAPAEYRALTLNPIPIIPEIPPHLSRV